MPIYSKLYLYFGILASHVQSHLHLAWPGPAHPQRALVLALGHSGLSQNGTYGHGESHGSHRGYTAHSGCRRKHAFYGRYTCVYGHGHTREYTCGGKHASHRSHTGHSGCRHSGLSENIFSKYISKNIPRYCQDVAVASATATFREYLGIFFGNIFWKDIPDLEYIFRNIFRLGHVRTGNIFSDNIPRYCHHAALATARAASPEYLGIFFRNIFPSGHAQMCFCLHV